MPTRRVNYGWIPDLPDHRDHIYTAPQGLTLPPNVDLRAQVPEIYDQGQLGSCTANALASAFQHMRKLQGDGAWRPSRLFIYFGERDIESTVGQDAGAMIRDGIKFLAERGVCPETEGPHCWPYDVAQFTTRPRPDCYVEARKAQLIRYRRVMPSLEDMKSVLAEGHPFVGGIPVYESFESEEVAQTGRVPIPGADEALKGGHAVKFVGYDDGPQWFIGQNSWSDRWGDGGFFYLPYEFMLKLSDDRWVITKTE